MIDGFPIDRFNLWDLQDLQQSLSTDYLGHLEGMLLRRAAAPCVAEYNPGQTLFEELSQLPRGSVRRLLESPELGYRIRFFNSDEAEDLVTYLDRCLEAEKLVARGLKPTRLVWTALGDHRWAECEHSEALRIGGSIVLDWESPWCWKGAAGSDMDRPDIQAIDAGTAAQLQAKLQRALDLVESVSPSSAKIIKDNLKVIQLRRIGGEPDEVCSGSASGYVGQMLLGVADPARCPVSMLADALIHESIHNFLFVFGRRVPETRDFMAVESLRVTSPWTGNALTVYAFLHATLIWYSLNRFWTAASKSGVDLDEGAEKCRLRATVGFVGEADIGATLRQIGSALDPFWVRTCGEMQAEVRRTPHHSGSNHASASI